jgi:hypothetical protein
MVTGAAFRGERGSALLWVLGFIVTLGIVISASQLLARMAERRMYARNSVSRTELAAASAVEVLTDRVRAVAAQRLGNLSWPDMLAINISASSLASDLKTTGATIQTDTALTGVRIVDVREWEVIPHDEKILDAWTHQPRVSYDGLPDVGGSVAARTIEVEVYATAHSPREGRRMVTRRLAVSVIAPHQHALYAQGHAEVTGWGSEGLVGGPLRVDGVAEFGTGTHMMTYLGGIEARDGITVGRADHVVSGTSYVGGGPALSSLTRAASEANPAAMLAPWQGRVRIRPSIGGGLGPGRMQSSSVAGTGECPDFDAACFGRASFRPAITLRRVTTGIGTEYSYSCGTAYYDNGVYTCGTVARAPAIRYLPWPFAAAPPAGKAARDPDPANAGHLWRGLFPDFRREAACDASELAGRPYATFRCPTNAYGFHLDLSLLPAIQGGMIAIRRQAAASPGAQEVVLLRNAGTLAGPLTLVSEVPVVIWGSFNVNNPKPAMISAPRITVMPAETEQQLGFAMAWDRVAGEGETLPSVVPVQAQSNVTIYAVLRSGFCRSIGGAYFGGSFEGIPAAYGDWSRAALRVNGAVEGYDLTSAGAAACGAYWAPLNGAQPGDVPVVPPFQRSVLFNRRLLHPDGQPPGSWHWDNFDYLNTAIPGAPTRTRGRQINAFGGTTVLRLIQDLRTIPPARRGSALRPTGRTTPTPIPMPGLPPAL